jgi:hypothetical protein
VAADPTLATAGPVVNVSRQSTNFAEEAIASDPTNPKHLFVLANDVDRLRSGQSGVLASFSTDGGLTWTSRDIGTGNDNLPASAGDPTVTWDKFGNLFIGYLDFGNGLPNSVDVLLSTDGGASFTPVANVPGTGLLIDQPTLVTGPGPGGKGGSLWLQFNDAAGTNANVVSGAAVTGKGHVGSFSPLFQVPNSNFGNFGDIAVGPGGQVMVTFVHGDSGFGPDTVMVSVKPDGLGPGPFSPPVVATPTNVGSFDPILAQPNRTVDAEPGLAWDRSGGPHNGRAYLVYTDAPSVLQNDTITNVFVRFSDDQGATWSAPVQVNDSTGNLHFLPRIALDQTSGNVGVSFYDTRNDPANVGSEIFASFSTNGGVCFQQNVQVSTAPSRAVPDRDLGFDFGDYSGAWFDHGVYHPAWADNSADVAATNPSGTFQIATAAVSLAPLRGVEDAFEPNDTSDRARNFGQRPAGQTLALDNLTIDIHDNNLPDYDWFRFTMGAGGTFTAAVDLGANSGNLEVHLFTLNGSDTLVELGSASTASATSCDAPVAVAAAVRPGQVILVEVKGVETTPGVFGTGFYNLTAALQ